MLISASSAETAATPSSTCGPSDPPLWWLLKRPPTVRPLLGHEVLYPGQPLADRTGTLKAVVLRRDMTVASSVTLEIGLTRIGCFRQSPTLSLCA